MKSRTITTTLFFGLATLAGAALTHVGCTDDRRTDWPASAGDPVAPVAPSTSDDGVGSVNLDLTLQGGEQLNSLSYTVTGPNNSSSVIEMGNVDVHNSQVVSFVLGGIPAASGYKIALSSTSASGGTTCSGSATFAIAARASTNVSVLMMCSSAPADAGAANVTAVSYNCGTANSAVASPSETVVGTSVQVSASGAGPNASALTYQWSAPSGTFDASNAATTHFTCTTSGVVTLTVVVGDGPVPDGGACDHNSATATVNVTCDAP